MLPPSVSYDALPIQSAASWIASTSDGSTEQTATGADSGGGAVSTVSPVSVIISAPESPSAIAIAEIVSKLIVREKSLLGVRLGLA
jgi:hypothetical protein